MNQYFDFLIVGQGLAGTLLTYFLELEGKSVFVIDKIDASSSSHIAAGIIHPITGRRIVKSWKADELIPNAERIYQQIGEKFHQTFYFQKDIVEIFTSIKHQNDWLSRASEPEIAAYTGKEMDRNEIKGVINPLGAIVVKQGGFLLIHELLSFYKQHLELNKRISHENFDYSILHFDSQKITYQNIIAGEIIFCEGAQAQMNPYFNWLPFLPAKGEILTIYAPHLPEKFILNKGLYILPVGKSFFRVGATHDWSDLNNIPTEAARSKITRILSGILSVPYEIIDHKASIRPTVKDRRPFLGKHPVHHQLNIFNGLGTKGVMLAPWFASQLCEFLLHRKGLDPEVNISRFSADFF